jgi:hypothetical protein
VPFVCSPRANAPADPSQRLESVIEQLTRQVVEHEPELRAQLRLSLDSRPVDSDQLPFRKGRAIGWIEDALAPLREQMTARKVHRLALAIRATTGVEAPVWLTDVAGLSAPDARELMRSSARALLRDALRNDPNSSRHPTPTATRSKNAGRPQPN